MAEDSAFWSGTTVGDAASADIWKAPYSSEEWSDVWSKIFASDSSSGFVIPLHENELAVEAESPASMDVSVLSGVAKIRGRLYENTSTATLTIAANASGSPRIDRIILRTSFAAQTIRLAVLQGTPGGVPALPTLTQDANTWEVSLAYIWVANGATSIPEEEIHDERLFLKTSLSHKYEAGSQNLIRNSEFMGFSELSGGATTNPPDGWSLEATPSDIASATKYSAMPRGRAVQITTDAASEGIYQSINAKTLTPYTLKVPVNVTAGDVGHIRVAGDFVATSNSQDNQNSDVFLRGPNGAGGTVSNVGALPTALGDVGGVEYWVAQTFQPTAGRLTQITVDFGANSGAPVGIVTLSVYTDSGGPSSLLTSVTFTPTPSATNTILISDIVYLAGATTYWFVLSCAAQAANVYWSPLYSAGNLYANGSFYYSTDSGASWNISLNNDLSFSVTTVAVSLKDRLEQSFQLSGTYTITQCQLDLKKVGTPAGTLTLRIETDAAGNPSGVLADVNATITVAETSLATSYGLISFLFASSFSLSSGTVYHLVLSTDRAASFTNYVIWGADSSPSYASGEMKAEISAAWVAETKDACFYVWGYFLINRYIRRTGAYIEELIYITNQIPFNSLSIYLMGLNNGDVIKFGQCLVLAGRHPGPFREVNETILFKDGITDTNWSADAKSDGTTTIDLDSDFQSLVLPGTKSVLLVLTAKDAQATPTSSLAARKKSSTMDQIKIELTTAITNKNYSCQGWVALISNQFDLYVIDTIASSVISTAVIIGIDI